MERDPWLVCESGMAIPHTREKIETKVYRYIGIIMILI